MCGGPLLLHSQVSSIPTPELLQQALRETSAELMTATGVEDRERKREALQAVLLALQIHYPSEFRRAVADPGVARFISLERIRFG